MSKHTPGCHNWPGSLDNDGYGRIQIGKKWALAHRYTYELKFGRVPTGLQLDHLCRNRKCVNPDHLEPVTRKENILRGNGPTAVNSKKAECINGHKLAGNNLYLQGGRRTCRECSRARWRAYRKSKIAEGTWTRS